MDLGPDAASKRVIKMSGSVVKDASALDTALAALAHNVKELHLSSCTLDLAAVAPVLARVSGIEVLSIKSCDVDAAGLNALLPVLEAWQASLMILDLSNNPLAGPGSPVALCRALSLISGLRGLILRDSGLDANAVAALAEPLASMSQLALLGLGTNPLGPSGVSALVSSLACLAPSLAVLELNSCRLDSAAVADLAPVLARMNGLRSLQLDGNQLDDTAVQTVLQALARDEGLPTCQLRLG